MVVERPEVSAVRVKPHTKRPLIFRLELATMVNFQCAHCERTYKYRGGLARHMETKQPTLPIEPNVRGAGRSTGSIQYRCYQCDGNFSKRCHLDRHIRQIHGSQSFNCTLCGKACTRSINLEMHMRTCTGAAVAAVSSTQAHRGGTASSTPARSFTVCRRRRALGGAVEFHSVNMNAANQLVALEDAVLSLESTMTAYHRRHQAYKFQVAVDVMFHKAVDTTVVTQPPVTLRATMAAVYPVDVPQLVETAAHLLELIEVYEHNGSGWVFSNFVSLELSLWHLDPLRASAFVPLPKWIRDKHAVTNIVGTGDDCFKWAVLAALHPVTDHSNRMEDYLQYVNLYGFSSLSFPVPCLQ